MKKASKKVEPDISSFKPDDYGYWARMGHWEMFEAMLLLIDVDPRIIFPEFRRNRNIEDPTPIIADKMAKMKELLERGPYCISVKASPGSILCWAYTRKIPIPPELQKWAEELSLFDPIKPNLAEQKVKEESADFKNLRSEQRHRERCRGIASLLWASNPEITIADMILRDEIIVHGCEKKMYSENATRGWIKDLCPDRTPGRRTDTDSKK